MKKLFFLLSMSAIALSLFLSSCGDDKDDPKPAPSISAYIGTSSVKSITVDKDEPVTITYTVTTGENIEKIEVIERVGGSTKPVTGFPKTSKFKTSTSDEGVVVVVSTGTEVFYDFKVTDSKGATQTVTVTLNPASEAKTFATYTARLVGAQTNSEGSYFASVTGLVYKAADAATNKSIIDVTFAQIGSPTTTPRLISPDFRGDASIGLTAFADGTTTYFKASSLNFDTVNDSQLAAISASTSKSIIIAQGSTYEFVNAAGKKGLIKVTNYTAGTGTNGSITIDVKVQKSMELAAEVK
jgi:hypothetical protein